MHFSAWEVFFNVFSWEAILNCRALFCITGVCRFKQGKPTNGFKPQPQATQKLPKPWSTHLIIAAIRSSFKKNLWNTAGNEDKTLGEPKKQTTFWVSRTASSTMPLWLWKSRKRCWREDPVQYLLHEMKNMLIFPRISRACILFTLIHF